MNDDYPGSVKKEPRRGGLESTGNGGPDEPERISYGGPEDDDSTGDSTGNGGPEELDGIIGIEVTHTEIYDTSTGEGAVIDEYVLLVDDAGPTENAGGVGERESRDMPEMARGDELTGNGGPDERDE